MHVGAVVCSMVLEMEPMNRNHTDMFKTRTRLNKSQTKKDAIVRLRWVMKYTITWNKMAVKILFGKSQIIEAVASVNG